MRRHKRITKCLMGSNDIIFVDKNNKTVKGTKYMDHFDMHTATKFSSLFGDLYPIAIFTARGKILYK